MTGRLNVFAAASLTGAFNSAKTTLVAQNPGLNLTYNFAGSNTLVTQIQQGAPADVFASADTKNMEKLVTAGLVEHPGHLRQEQAADRRRAGESKAHHRLGRSGQARGDGGPGSAGGPGR